MTKGKDFYGAEIAELIEEACRVFGKPREELNIEVIETGSTGIFGLCKKKAHIRVQLKNEVKQTAKSERRAAPVKTPVQTAQAQETKQENHAEEQAEQSQKARPPSTPEALEGAAGENEADEPAATSPSPACLAAVEDKLSHILTLMGLPSQIQVSFQEGAIYCLIKGEHEVYLAGQDGRILDHLQYLLRKILGPLLPERVVLTLDAADYQARHLARLREQALELAEEVKQSGKSKSTPALNPTERLAVRQALQQITGIRSRSAGSGLLKKLFIVKDGQKDEKAGAN